MFKRRFTISSSDTEEPMFEGFEDKNSETIQISFLPNEELFKSPDEDLSGTQFEFPDAFSLNSSSSGKDESDNYNSRLKSFHDQFTKKFISLILEQDFEYGYESRGDIFVKELMKINKVITNAWLNQIFVDYFDNSRVLVSLLQILSHLSYEDSIPNGPTMAISALKHMDAEVRETGVRCFENWSIKDTLHILRSLRFSEDWLQEYVDQVIKDQEGQLT